MKRKILYFNLSLIYLLRNRSRFVLTVVGVVIGLFIFFIGNICIETYVESMYKEVNYFDDDSILIIDSNQKIINNLVERGYSNNLRKYSMVGSKYIVAKEYIYRDKKISFGINLVGADYNLSNCALPYKLDEKTMVSKSRLLYGRDINFEDIKLRKNVIIIEKSTAKMLFLDENAVGEYLDVISPYGYDSFEVIGIIEDLPYLKQHNFIFNSYIKNEKIEEVKYYFYAYTPYTYLEDMVDDDIYFKPYVFDKEKNQISEMDMKMEIEWGDVDYSIITKSQLVAETRIVEKELKGILMIIVIFVILLSSFLNMTMYIFSIKERTYEIGIRRAVGATKLDIILQFVLEGIITALFAFVVTVFISVVICNFASVYFVEKLSIDIKIIIVPKLLFGTAGIAILEGILFSIIPAFIAARIRPTESIRWD